MCFCNKHSSWRYFATILYVRCGGRMVPDLGMIVVTIDVHPYDSIPLKIQIGPSSQYAIARPSNLLNPSSAGILRLTEVAISRTSSWPYHLTFVHTRCCSLVSSLIRVRAMAHSHSCPCQYFLLEVREHQSLTDIYLILPNAWTAFVMGYANIATSISHILSPPLADPR